jgi:hypothetical protein
MKRTAQKKFQKVLTFVPWKASEFATMNTAPLPAELSTLRELVVSLQTALEESRRENTLLRQKIDSLVRRVFGSSSERLDRAQAAPSSSGWSAPSFNSKPAEDTCHRVCWAEPWIIRWASGVR